LPFLLYIASKYASSPKRIHLRIGGAMPRNFNVLNIARLRCRDSQPKKHIRRIMAQEATMKILRSVNRRGFNVGTAGWFTVLKPNTWFAASRLQGASRPFTGQVMGTWHQGPKGHATTAGAFPASGRETAVSLQALKLSAHDRSPMRLALAATAAIAITSGLLWWMIQAQ
jgi:hypothetical protein